MTSSPFFESMLETLSVQKATSYIKATSPPFEKGGLGGI
jgi:hypothetical protein